MLAAKVTYLLKNGYTQESLASIFKCDQSTVGRIASGETKNPLYRVGDSINKLYEKTVSDYEKSISSHGEQNV